LLTVSQIEALRRLQDFPQPGPGIAAGQASVELAAKQQLETREQMAMPC